MPVPGKRPITPLTRQGDYWRVSVAINPDRAHSSTATIYAIHDQDRYLVSTFQAPLHSGTAQLTFTRVDGRWLLSHGEKEC